MTEPVSTPKVDPETLVLRGRPRRVVRFKRNVLIGTAAIGCVAIIGVTWMGLRRPDVKSPAQQGAQYDPDKMANAQKPTPDQLQALPKSYADVPAGVPQLGPPLPGDLGRPILEHQQAQAMATQTATSGSPQPIEKGRDAGLFFQVADHATSAGLTPVGLPQVADLGVPAPLTSKAGLALDLDKDQNAQGQKRAFVDKSAAGVIYNGHTFQTPASPYQVMAGTVIAQVTEPVYDTVTGQILLIPQGSRLIGQYDSVVAFGQSRALLVWQRLILPDGSSLEIDNLPATDASGYSGLSSEVDYHTWSLIKGIGLSTLLGITAQQGSSDDSDLVKALRQSAQQNANQTGQKIVEKTLDVQPSLKVRPGWPLRVIVHKDLILKPYVE